MVSRNEKGKECSDAKNAVYDMRDKLGGGEYENNPDDRHRQKILQDLRITETYLYDQGINQEKYIYID